MTTDNEERERYQRQQRREAHHRMLVELRDRFRAHYEVAPCYLPGDWLCAINVGDREAGVYVQINPEFDDWGRVRVTLLGGGSGVSLSAHLAGGLNPTQCQQLVYMLDVAEWNPDADEEADHAVP